MKIIDLLNKIANGEEIPNKLFYKIDDTYKSEFRRVGGNDYYSDDVGACLFSNYDIPKILNDEVEIIEEDKKIEKLPSSFYESPWLLREDRDIAKKINEIIDKINKMEDK